MPRLKNPPPKRVRLTKNLGYETRKFLNHIHFRLTVARTAIDLDDVKHESMDDLCTLCANWNTWWDQEKRGRRRRPCDPSKALQDHWRRHYET